MGELEPWIDEAFVRNIWFQMGEPVNVKMIRDKFSGYAYAPFRSICIANADILYSRNAGYCFVDFNSPAAAAKALTLNGNAIPGSVRPFKLNWASGGGLADRRCA